MGVITPFTTGDGAHLVTRNWFDLIVLCQIKWVIDKKSRYSRGEVVGIVLEMLSPLAVVFEEIVWIKDSTMWTYINRYIRYMVVHIFGGTLSWSQRFADARRYHPSNSIDKAYFNMIRIWILQNQYYQHAFLCELSSFANKYQSPKKIVSEWCRLIRWNPEGENRHV